MKLPETPPEIEGDEMRVELLNQEDHPTLAIPKRSAYRFALTGQTCRCGGRNAEPVVTQGSEYPPALPPEECPLLLLSLLFS